MKYINYTLQFVFLLICSTTFSQSAIGHSTITYNDPSRTGGYGSGGGAGRQIQCEVYYPATTAGDNTPAASGTYPIIVFGHGFVMTWDSYANIWEHYVPMGYIFIFPRTEGGFSPSHAEFGADLVVSSNRLIADCSNPAFSLYSKWNGKTAVMGHSMGGGSTFLAASNQNAAFDALIGLAPAETTPSAISAAGSIAIPSIVFSGTEDAVTPPQDHHTPIYNAIPSSNCKQFVSITGGAHCYFANSSTTCDFGESSSGGNIGITRAQQHTITFDVLDPFLDFYLKGNCPSWNTFTTQLTTHAGIVGTNDCNYSLPQNPVITQNGNNLNIVSSLQIQWFKDGQALVGENGTSLSILTYGSGDYTATVTDLNNCSATSNIISLTTNGLENEVLSSFSVYPNPATTELNILSSGKLNKVSIYSLEGRLIQTIPISETNTVVSVSHFSSGIYLIQSENGKQQRLVKN